MRKEFNDICLREVKRITGLPDGALHTLVGAAIITATLGKVPIKKDLAFYLGMTERELDQQSKAAVDLAWESWEFQRWNAGGLGCSIDSLRPSRVYYALATDLINAGAFCAVNESPEHRLARNFLSKYFNVSAINTRALFTGYSICLEYLTVVARGMELGLSHFLKARYGQISSIPVCLQTFCNYINTDRRGNAVICNATGYSSVMLALAEGLTTSIEEDEP